MVTGARSDYGILRPVLFALMKSRNVRISLIVTGMHLSEQFGLTVREIEEDGFPIDARVDMLLDGATPVSMAKSAGIGVLGISSALDLLRPDILLVAGDRMEPLAAAIAASYMNIPVAHIHGGDRSVGGHIDDSIRHAITKLAQIHFPASEESRERIIRMGEDPDRVFVTGAPALDTILGEPLTGHARICRKYGLDPGRVYILVVQNPVTREADDAGRQMGKTLEAVRELGIQALVVYPNADAGGQEMIDVIRRYHGDPLIHAVQSLPHKDYLSLLKGAGALVGNSSSGIIEAPSLHIPVVNIGSRQKGRERAENVLDAPYSRAGILKAIRRALEDEGFRERVRTCRNPYGDGYAAERIVGKLTGIKITRDLLRKEITY